jgi:hypothetical protein
VITKPHVLGAPLQGDEQPPTLAEIDAEIKRAEIELMYAIAKHRKAWKVMRQRAEARDEASGKVGMLSTLESDPHWKKATGDVSWWRDEMTAQASALQALRHMRIFRAVVK